MTTVMAGSPDQDTPAVQAPASRLVAAGELATARRELGALREEVAALTQERRMLQIRKNLRMVTNSHVIPVVDRERRARESAALAAERARVVAALSVLKARIRELEQQIRRDERELLQRPQPSR